MSDKIDVEQLADYVKQQVEYAETLGDSKALAYYYLVFNWLKQLFTQIAEMERLGEKPDAILQVINKHRRALIKLSAELGVDTFE